MASAPINKPRKTDGRFASGHSGGPGRPKGSANKVNKLLKDMVSGALEELGGQEYLVRIGREDPKTFLALVAKLLPSEQKLTHAGTAPIQVITGVSRNPDDPLPPTSS